mgnify:CR=1 FL=1
MNAPTSPDRMQMTLTDRYTEPSGWLYMTGMQALVRLPIQQRLRDTAAGLNTGGYISGYRGSPMGRYDIELWAAEKYLQEQNIVFRAGVNEDMAATALWGSQYVGHFPGAKVDGVFGIWYGKGPGVDRSGDPLRHANQAGSGRLGGVLAIAGDDHGAKSSTVANYSDLNFIAAGIPVLYPANAQELLDLGLHGIAMSRYSGCWVGMKVVTDVVEGGGSVYVAPDSPVIELPPLPTQADGGLNSRRVDMPLPQEERLYHHKHLAVLAYARANRLNRITVNPANATVGVMAAGKAWQDLQQAMLALGLTEQQAAERGVRIMKVGMVWPLDPEIIREFATGLAAVVIVEEKRPLLEDQLRAVLYGTANPPALYGKHDQGTIFDARQTARLFPNAGEISPGLIASILNEVLRRHAGFDLAAERAVSLAPVPGFTPALAAPAQAEPAQPAEAQLTNPLPKTIEIKRDTGADLVPVRAPTFCSGCPHARSTKVPDGSRALAGIGCHATAIFKDPVKTTTWSHMGGEGVLWVGQQPFTDEKHVFANIGDGTLFHSGFLAVRQAVAAKVPMTYKVLYNGFVSMTGGQAVDGEMTVPGILAQFAAEGVRKMAIVTDEPAKYEGVKLPDGTPVYDRTELDKVQLEFREYPNVSVIVYDQPCATERRRLRKRGKWEDPNLFTFINSAVCEGCGDCGQVSNCLSVEPLETELGRKRRINQSSCNKDFTCAEGFCPSFVTVSGAQLRGKGKPAAGAAASAPVPAPAAVDNLPEPDFKMPQRSWSILVTGIGGTGVVTIGQTLAVAAHLQGYYSSNLDVTGLSQKYGAVHSHIKLAPEPQMLHATRIASGEADALVGCDLIVSASDETLERLAGGKTGGALCTDMVPTSEFSSNPNWSADVPALTARISDAMDGNLQQYDALRLARELLGDSIGANMMLLGTVWQMGKIPLTLAAIHRAIELNGVAIALNKAAFDWGRQLAIDPEAVEKVAAQASRRETAAGSADTGSNIVSLSRPRLTSLQDIVEHRQALLTRYQSKRYAKRFARRIEAIRAAEQAATPGSEALSIAAARGLAKLMAHKDEFEVARLYTDPAFRQELRATFDGDDIKLQFHVAGGPFGKRDPKTGQVTKSDVGPWLMSAFKIAAKLRFLRGTVFDLYRNNDERKLARELLSAYEADLDLIASGLSGDNAQAAIELAGWPDAVRGYGHVRKAHAEAAMQARSAAQQAFKAPAGSTSPEALAA